MIAGLGQDGFISFLFHKVRLCKVSCIGEMRFLSRGEKLWEMAKVHNLSLSLTAEADALTSWHHGSHHELHCYNELPWSSDIDIVVHTLKYTLMIKEQNMV